MTLEAFVVELFKRKETNTDVFKSLVSIYGAHKIASFWEKANKEKNEDKKIDINSKVNYTA